MDEKFNPYIEWLGIPEHQLPPTHYRLLGVETYESNTTVISNAADRAMLFIRTFQTGPHSAESQRVLNEISAARVCLLNKKKKAEYDESLREKGVDVSPKKEPEASSAQPSVSAAVPRAASVKAIFEEEPQLDPSLLSAVTVSKPVPAPTKKLPLPMLISAGGVFLVLVLALVFFLKLGPPPTPHKAPETRGGDVAETVSEDPRMAVIKKLGISLDETSAQCPPETTDADLENIRKFSTLRKISLRKCDKITDAGLLSLKDLPELRYLTLEGCEQISDAGLKHLTSLLRLQDLNLSKNPRITDAGVESLAELTALQKLDVSECPQLTDAAVETLKRLTQLKTLAMMECPKITGDAVEGLTAALAGCKISHESKDSGTRVSIKNAAARKPDPNAEPLIPLPVAMRLGFSDDQLTAKCSGEVTDDDLAQLKHTKLENLVLVRCFQFTDAGLASLKDVPTLKKLDLRGCTQITPAGLFFLKNCPVLEELILDDCTQVTNNYLPAVGQLTQLRVLNLGECAQITDDGVEHFANLTQLKTLFLGGCRNVTQKGGARLFELLPDTYLSGIPLPPAIQTAMNARQPAVSPPKEVIETKVAGTEAAGVTVSVTADPPQRTAADFQNFVTGPSPEDMPADVLERLGFSDDKIVAKCKPTITDADLAYLKNSQLKELKLDKCTQITDAGLAHFQEMPKLISLSLGWCTQITDDGLKHLKNVPNLQTLYLTKCQQMTNDSLAILAELPDLRELYLANCPKITDDGLAHLKNMSQLRKLDLQWCNKLTDRAVQKLKSQMPNCEISF